jgi:hypothetical protein
MLDLSIVMPAKAGIQYSVRARAAPTFCPISDGSGYWIIRFRG